jgi:Family of unknown function (DUF6088)
MSAVADKITKRVRAKGRGWAFTPKDFLDFGTRASVDMALMRLLQANTIRRIGRGLYDYPKQHPTLGSLTPDTSAIMQAVAVQSGDKVADSGAIAANRLGFSTQVPAKATFMTTGVSRKKTVAGRTINLKKSRAPILDQSAKANAVLQMLALIGKTNINDDLLARCASRLDDHDLAALKKSQALMPGWMSDAVFKIGRVKHG